MIIQADIKHILNRYRTFRDACRVGDLDTIKSLLSQNLVCINIHAENKAFNEACYFGHLEVVKYLISLNRPHLSDPDSGSGLSDPNNIDIHANDESAFRYACHNGQLEVVNYLWEMDKTFKIKYDYKWSPSILKWYNEEYLKVNPNIRDIIQKDGLCVIKDGIMRKCNICYDEKHVIMFGCHEDHFLCKDCFLEYYNKGPNDLNPTMMDENIQYKCLYCMKQLTVDHMYITR